MKFEVARRLYARCYEKLRTCAKIRVDSVFSSRVGRNLDSIRIEFESRNLQLDSVLDQLESARFIFESSRIELNSSRIELTRIELDSLRALEFRCVFGKL